MTIPRISIGELDVLIAGKTLPIGNALTAEQQAVAEALTERLNERIGRHFDFQVAFTGIPVQRANMQVMKHRRRFETREV